jgi:hypothetical protein
MEGWAKWSITTGNLRRRRKINEIGRLVDSDTIVVIGDDDNPPELFHPFPTPFCERIQHPHTQIDLQDPSIRPYELGIFPQGLAKVRSGGRRASGFQVDTSSIDVIA